MNSEKYQVGFETITPERAKAFLEKCPRNRNASDKRVCMYSDMMSGEKWGPFSMIIFDEEGNLVDGGHRCRAIIKSGKTVKTLVFRGLEKKFIPFIDTGRPRSAGDMLAFMDGMDGIGSLRNTSSMVRSMLRYDKHDFGCVVPYDDIASYILDNKDLVKKAMSDYVKVKPIGGTLATTAAICAIRKNNPSNQEHIDKFIDEISNGENISSGMPSYAVRNAIFASSRRSSGGGGSRQMVDMYTVIRGWVAEINGEELKLIKTGMAKATSLFDFNIIEK